MMQEEPGEMLQVNCPMGAAPGEIIAVNTLDGRQLQVAVPAGISPGMAFQVVVPDRVHFCNPLDVQALDKDSQVCSGIEATPMYVIDET